MSEGLRDGDLTIGGARIHRVTELERGVFPPATMLSRWTEAHTAKL